jgi:hypothetical protein
VQFSSSRPVVQQRLDAPLLLLLRDCKKVRKDGSWVLPFARHAKCGVPLLVRDEAQLLKLLGDEQPA